MNRCVVEGCPKQIPPLKLMCVTHWSAVPRELKLHLWVLCETGFARLDPRETTTPWRAAVQAAAREALKCSGVPSSGSPVGR